MAETDLFIMDDNKPEQPKEQQKIPEHIEIVERKPKKKKQYTEETYSIICENMRKGREARAKKRAEREALKKKE